MKTVTDLLFINFIAEFEVEVILLFIVLEFFCFAIIILSDMSIVVCVTY